MHTPEQQITPDFNDSIECDYCNGKGKVLIINEDQDEEDEWQEYETCIYCDGEGTINENDN